MERDKQYFERRYPRLRANKTERSSRPKVDKTGQNGEIDPANSGKCATRRVHIINMLFGVRLCPIG